VPPAGVPRPFTRLHQVHGTRVVVVTEPAEHAGTDADAALTVTPGCALAVMTADCAPVALLADEAVGVVHAGWRGLLAGIVEQAVDAIRTLGAGPSLRAVIGPCIRAGCYEFRGSERDALAARYGDAVLAETMWGTPALDVVAGVEAALAAAGIGAVQIGGGCTACDRTWFSHRARGDAGRQAAFVWRSDPRAAPTAVRE
jgi:purine-nucleoside/S-methyl-5'-thioadenosine phosphorylase / adenosine deaminase